MSSKEYLFRRVMLDGRTVTQHLHDITDAENARQVASSFLRIRPTGGRVYIDEDGDACTPMGPGRVVYLGRVQPPLHL